MADPGARRVDTANAVLEGDDATTDAVTPTVRLGNICQISDKVARVTGTQQAVEHAGRDDELAYQEMLKGLELKRDMESILVGTNQAKVAGDATTARKTASVLSWIKTNTNKGAGGADPSAADGTGTRDDGTQRAFTEAQLKSVLQVGLEFRRQAGHRDGRRLQQAGVLDLHRPRHPDRGHQAQEDHRRGRRLRVRLRHAEGGAEPLPARARRAGAADATCGRWPISTGRKMVSIPLAKTGDSERRQLLSEYALVSAQREGLRRRVRSHGVVSNTAGVHPSP